MSIYIKASELRAGDLLYLNYDTGVRIGETRRVGDKVAILGSDGQGRITNLRRPNEPVRLHRRDVPA